MLNAITIRNLQARFRLQNPWVVFGAGIFTAVCGLLFVVVYSLRERLGPVDPLSLHPLDSTIRVYYGLLISLTYLVLFVYGTLCVAESVAGLKEDNAYNFERIAPRSAWSFAFGNLVGAPLYAYFLTVLGLIFAAFTVLFSSPDGVKWSDFFCHIIVLAGGAFLLHGFALFTSTILERRLSAFLITLVIVAVYFAIGFLALTPSPLSRFSVLSPTSYALKYFPIAVAAGSSWTPTFFGAGLGSPHVLSFVVQLMLGFGFLAAAARKFDRPDNVPISKLEVLVVLGALSALVTAIAWQHVAVAASPRSTWWTSPESRASFYSFIELILLVNIAGWIILCFASAPTIMDYRRYYDPHRLSKRSWHSYLFGTGGSILPTGLLNGVLLAAVLFFVFLVPGGYLRSLGQSISGRKIWADILTAWGLAAVIVLFYTALTGLLALSSERSGKVYALVIFCFFFIFPFIIVNFTGAENREIFFVLNPFTAVLPALPDAGVSIKSITAMCCGGGVSGAIEVDRGFHILTAFVFYGISTIVLSILLFVRQKKLRRIIAKPTP